MSIDDFLQMREIGNAKLSPDGRFVAIEIRRPREQSQQMRSDHYFEGRSDLWIHDLSSGERVQVRQPNAESGAWAPVWSPDGKRLAFVTNEGPSARLGIWNVESGHATLPSSGALDVTANFGSASRAPPAGRLPIAWLDSHTLLMVQLPLDQADPEMGPTYPTQYFGEYWKRSWQGKVSATVWDSRRLKPCGEGNELIRLDLASNRVTTLASGAVRAVSLSPDRKSALVVRAIEPRRERPNDLAERSLDYTAYNLDARVETDVLLVNLDTSIPSLPTLSRRGVGFQSAADFPIWSEVDGAAFVPALARGDAAALYRLDPQDGRTVKLLEGPHVRIRLAAELSRKINAKDSGSVLAQLPSGLRNEAQIFRFRERVGILDLGEFILFDSRGAIERRMSLGQGRIVLPQAGSVVEGHALLRRASGEYAEIHVTADGQIRLVRVRVPPATKVVFESRADSHLVLYGNGMDERVAQVTATKGIRDLLTVNEHLANAEMPRSQIIDLGLPGDQRYAEIIYPPGFSFAAVRPTVIFGYPGLVLHPDRDNAFFGVASRNAFTFGRHIPYLLTAAGFVVVRPSIPMRRARVVGPLRSIGEEIELVAAGLIKRGLAESGRIGYYGHSYGGYAGLAVAIGSKIVNAVVVSAAFADLIDYAWHLPPHYRYQECGPSIARLRAQELEGNATVLAMPGPPHANIQQYVRDSPLFRSPEINSPLLLLHGEFDLAPLSSVEKLFLSLERQGKVVELVQYWGEVHSLQGPGNVRDAWERIRGWFDTYLK